MFALQIDQLCIGYFVVVNEESANLEYTQINSFDKMLVNAIENCYLSGTMQKSNDLLKELSEHDSLTALYNRLGMEMEGRKFFLKLHPERNVAFWFIDVDNMKMINDNFGHRAGDEMLCGTAAMLQSIGNVYGLFVIRYGGDEFLMFGAADPDEINREIHARMQEVVIHNYNDSLEEYDIGEDVRGGTHEALSVSVGIYVCEHDSCMKLEECISRADRKMYEEKKRRKIRRGI